MNITESKNVKYIDNPVHSQLEGGIQALTFGATLFRLKFAWCIAEIEFMYKSKNGFDYVLYTPHYSSYTFNDIQLFHLSC